MPDRREALAELAGVLRGNLLAAEPRDVARISREYRECLAELDRADGAEEVADDDGPIVGNVIPLRVA